MKAIPRLNNLLFLLMFSSSVACAGTYLELSSGLIFVDTPADVARPTLADFRLGYEKSNHQLELAFMTSINKGDVNRLQVDVPSIVSVLYHYTPERRSSLKINYILGASWIDIESTFPGISNSSEDFYGVSYGLGFEEHFESMPQLKLSLDLLQLYRGDALDIYTLSLGFHYEF